MHNHYSDLYERIAEPPVWFDEHAVPRWCTFGPDQIAYIYGSECALLHIRCQRCGQRFDVAISELSHREKLWRIEVDHTLRGLYPQLVQKKFTTLAELIQSGGLRYGDPPNVRCCDAGPTMTAEMAEVLEYWYKPVVRGEGVVDGSVRDPIALQWHRDHELEISLTDD